MWEAWRGLSQLGLLESLALLPGSPYMFTGPKTFPKIPKALPGMRLPWVSPVLWPGFCFSALNPIRSTLLCVRHPTAAADTHTYAQTPAITLSPSSSPARCSGGCLIFFFLKQCFIKFSGYTQGWSQTCNVSTSE